MEVSVLMAFIHWGTGEEEEEEEEEGGQLGVRLALGLGLEEALRWVVLAPESSDDGVSRAVEAADVCVTGVKAGFSPVQEREQPE